MDEESHLIVREVEVRQIVGTVVTREVGGTVVAVSNQRLVRSSDTAAQESGVMSVILLLPISITFLVIGHLYLFDCRVQVYIPIFLIVLGYVTILGLLLESFKTFIEDKCSKVAFKIAYAWLLMFLVAWWIMGNVWVYGVNKVNYEDVTSAEYCNKTLYLFSFWFLNIFWAWCVFACCGLSGCFG